MTTVTEGKVRANRKCKCGKKYSRKIARRIERFELPRFGHGGVELIPSISYRVSYQLSPDHSFALYGIEGFPCECGRDVFLVPVEGVYRADKKCDARCTSATGHKCECSCGGKNHGEENE